MSFRLIYNWGVSEDFGSLPDALEAAAAKLREPVTDPAMQQVHIVDLDRWSLPDNHNFGHPTIFEGLREVVQRA
jgi:hypothetical protein